MTAHKPIRKGRVSRCRARHAISSRNQGDPEGIAADRRDRPLIQYAVDEAREAGIEQIIFVTGRGKTAIVEHFDMAFELETTMEERGKDLSVLDPTRATPGDIITVRQQVPLAASAMRSGARARS